MKLACAIVVALAAGLACAQSPPAAKPLPDSLARELSESLRSLLLFSLPEPLHEDDSHWGGQKPVPRRIKFRAGGLEVVKKPKNDGDWWKVIVIAQRPAETLQIEVRDLKQVEPGKLTFTTHLALDMHVDYDRQKWRDGIRLWSAGLRARMRAHLTLACEVQSSLVQRDGPFPELTFRLRAVQSQVGYDNVKVEHIAGIGGDGAKILGDLFLRTVRQWRPSLERKLLEKANAAIVKAGDTKEVRVGLLGVTRQ
jgi:hypothetical protein